MPSFTRPGSSVIDYNAVTGDSVTTAAQKHDIAVDDLYTNIVDATTTAKGLVQLGTTSDKAALGNHLHTGVYQPLDADLTAIAGLTSAADSLPYFTGSGTASLATFTAAGRALVDDADVAAQRGTLELGTAAVADIGTTAGKLVPLDEDGRLPAVSGSLLTGIGDVVRGYTRQQYMIPVQHSTTSGAVALDADIHADVIITPTAAFNVSAPTHPAQGKYITMSITGDTACAISWNAVFMANSDVALPTASIANKWMVCTFRCINGTNWILVGKVVN